MKQPSTQNTFRRKQIADSEPERKAQASADESNESLTSISDTLQGNQAATELVADVVETKGNQIIGALDSLNKTSQDIVAGTELSAEASERTTDAVNNLSDISSAISEKLSNLIANFEGKLSGTNKQLPAPIEQPQADSPQEILDNIPVAHPGISILKELLEKLIPDNHTLPESPLPSDDDDSDSNKKDGKGTGIGLEEKLDALIGITKSGFKGSLAVTDRIASMLFQYTVSAALQAAKTAAMILGIIMALDVLQVSFRYWSDLFNKDFKSFFDETKEWGPLIASVLEMASTLKHFWDEGNFAGLIVAFAKGMADMTIKLADLLFLGTAKITAAILRAVGFSETADNMEGAALQKFQEGGASLDKEDQQTLAKYQIRKEDEDYENKKDTYNKYKNRPEGLAMAEKYGTVSKETAAEIRSGEIQDPSKGMTEQERINAKVSKNETKAAIVRTKELIKNTREGDKYRAERLNKAVEGISGELDNSNMDEKDKKELKANLIEMSKTIDTKIKPAQVKPEATEEKPEVQQVQRIEREQRKSTTPVAPATPDVNVNTVISKTNKTMYNMPPTTSTPSPGMHGAMRIN